MTFSTNTIILFSLLGVSVKGPNATTTPSPGPSVCLVIVVAPGARTTSHTPAINASNVLVSILYYCTTKMISKQSLICCAVFAYVFLF